MPSSHASEVINPTQEVHSEQSMTDIYRTLLICVSRTSLSDIPCPSVKRFFRKVRVYVSGENLYYWSPLKKHNKTIDPELAISSSTYSSNTGSGYAYPRVYTVGVDITFN